MRRDAPALATALDRAAADGEAKLSGANLNTSINVLQREARAGQAPNFSPVSVEGLVLWEDTLLEVRLVAP